MVFPTQSYHLQNGRVLCLPLRSVCFVSFSCCTVLAGTSNAALRAVTVTPVPSLRRKASRVPIQQRVTCRVSAHSSWNRGSCSSCGLFLHPLPSPSIAVLLKHPVVPPSPLNLAMLSQPASQGSLLPHLTLGAAPRTWSRATLHYHLILRKWPSITALVSHIMRSERSQHPVIMKLSRPCAEVEVAVSQQPCECHLGN